MSLVGPIPFSDADLIPLSALQHYWYCPRQCALIHVESEWTENLFTAEGRVMHRRVDERENGWRDGVLQQFAVPLRSLKYGLTGKADVVEYRADDAGTKNTMPYPVEHKRGRPKPTRCDEVQLCAQALCLEEMTGKHVPEGAIFYGQPRRRLVVVFDDSLRAETEKVIHAVHALVRSGKTPPAVYDKARCDRCSLIEQCRPKEITRDRSGRYLSRMIEDLEEDE